MRVALGISYLGTSYSGWQSQPNGCTVQDQIEAALNRFANTAVLDSISTVCAGRTDAGVHAQMQVVHFDTDILRDEASWVRGVNSLLNKDIAVQWARFVPSDFHCRASAISRRYMYIIVESPVRPVLSSRRVGWVFRAMDIEAMQLAASFLLGEKDFSSFRASQCQSLSPVKTLHKLDISYKGGELNRFWCFEFEANAFLHHMIRNVMGCLVMVGQRLRSAHWMKEVLDAKNRAMGASTFSPDGLYFLGPTYDAKWQLPQSAFIPYELI